MKNRILFNGSERDLNYYCDITIPLLIHKTVLESRSCILHVNSFNDGSALQHSTSSMVEGVTRLIRVTSCVADKTSTRAKPFRIVQQRTYAHPSAFRLEAQDFSEFKCRKIPL